MALWVQTNCALNFLPHGSVHETKKQKLPALRLAMQTCLCYELPSIVEARFIPCAPGVAMPLLVYAGCIVLSSPRLLCLWFTRLVPVLSCLVLCRVVSFSCFLRAAPVQLLLSHALSTFDESGLAMFYSARHHSVLFLFSLCCVFKNHLL